MEDRILKRAGPENSDPERNGLSFEEHRRREGYPGCREKCIPYLGEREDAGDQCFRSDSATGKIQ